MNRKILIAVFLISLLLFSGWIAYRLVAPGADLQTDNGFRQWLWSDRQFDLLLQMVLIFAGALSIAAILQVKENSDD